MSLSTRYASCIIFRAARRMSANRVSCESCTGGRECKLHVLGEGKRRRTSSRPSETLFLLAPPEIFQCSHIEQFAKASSDRDRTASRITANSYLTALFVGMLRSVGERATKCRKPTTPFAHVLRDAISRPSTATGAPVRRRASRPTLRRQLIAKRLCALESSPPKASLNSTKHTQQVHRTYVQRPATPRSNKARQQKQNKKSMFSSTP